MPKGGATCEDIRLQCPNKRGGDDARIRVAKKIGATMLDYEEIRIIRARAPKQYKTIR